MDCNDTPPAGLLKGIAEFNRREYFQCHETLEAVWLPETGPVRAFYQGIIQVAVGMLHTQRGNYRGAASLLGQGIEKLQQFPPRCLGVETGALVEQARRCRAAVLALGEDGIGRFPWEEAPVIQAAPPGPLSEMERERPPDQE